MTATGQMLALLTAHERRRGLVVVFVAMVSAVADALSVASLLPFLSVLTNPDIIQSNGTLAKVYGLGHFSNTGDFVFVLGLMTLTAVVGAALVRAFSQYAISRYSNIRRFSIGQRLLDSYLGRPYAFFINRNSADLAKRVLSDVDLAVTNCLAPAIQIVAQAAVSLLLVSVVILVDPVVGSSVLLAITGAYALIYFGTQKFLRRIGQDRNVANRQRFVAVEEAFGGIKEVKLLGVEAVFSRRYLGPALRFARHGVTSDVVSQLPRNFFEAMAIGGALTLALVLLRTGHDVGTVLPIVGLYAFAGYRLLPAAQGIYQALSTIRFGLPAVNAVLEDMAPATEPVPAAESSGVGQTRLPFHSAIRLEGIAFRYPDSKHAVVEDVNLEIGRGTALGIVGKTGSGKTTLVDILLGLLEPTEGRILVDGVAIGADNLRRWQRDLGYVPQSIYLADATVAENIAFGVAPEAIDRAALERAARVAEIHDFVVTELQNGYDTFVGERGVRLSGGQRQRIGIARALYRDPPVLVFDEATSALDGETEAAVMSAISRLGGEKTIIVIAHRLTTVEGCDQLVEISRGRLAAQRKPLIAVV